MYLMTPTLSVMMMAAFIASNMSVGLASNGVTPGCVTPECNCPALRIGRERIGSLQSGDSVVIRPTAESRYLSSAGFHAYQEEFEVWYATAHT